MNIRIRLIAAAALVTLAAGARAEEAAFVLGGDAAKGEATYKQLCVVCHGEAGKGDGAGSAALNPKPRDFTNKEVMAKLSDKELFTIVRDGGASMGKSMFMTAYKALKTDQELRDVVAYVRTLAK